MREMKSRLSEILDADVVAVESTVDGLEAPLMPEEAVAVERATATRRSEFATTRCCARAALEMLGCPTPSVPSKNRAPVWPEGVVGSLTHCAGYRAAAVAWSRTHLSLGIDAEPHLRLPDDVRPLVLAAGDCTGRIEGVHTDRVVFSAKESYYKAWSPVQQTWLDFSDVRVRLAPDGTFEASIVGEVDRGSVPTMALGRWRVVDGLILTSVTWRR